MDKHEIGHMNRLEVNAALWNLAQGKDIPESAKTVILFGETLKKRNSVSISRVGNKKGSEPGIKGATSHGEFYLSNEQSPEKVDWEHGYHKERIGHFKMWRNKSGNIIWFQHFWKSDTATKSDTEEVSLFRIRYNPNTLDLEHFGIRQILIKFTLSCFSFHITFGREIFDPIFEGEVEYGELCLEINHTVWK